jgi:hypothetical protein
MERARLPRFLTWWAVVGAVIPVAAFLTSLAVPLFPISLLHVVSALCPPYLLFLATANCAPSDWCSLSTLGIVSALNALLYILAGSLFLFLRRVIANKPGGVS